jgi:secondary thiamine-phosphate synthase enzyme
MIGVKFMIIREITVTTSSRNQMLSITEQVQKLVESAPFSDGKITVYIPHTTAAVTINEDADPDVTKDILLALQKISPNLQEFKHLEGNSDAHVKSSLIGNTQDVFFSNKRLLLGTWQGIFFCEFDGPRTRKAQLFITEL